MKLFKLFLSGLAILILSCNASKKTNENTSKMIKEGYSSGVIIVQKNSGCPYVIKLDNGTLYDPINLAHLWRLKNADEKVWFTFRRLRRRNRCDQANPIELIDIQKTCPTGRQRNK